MKSKSSRKPKQQKSGTTRELKPKKSVKGGVSRSLGEMRQEGAAKKGF